MVLNGGKLIAFKLEIFKLYVRLYINWTLVLLSLGVNIREEFHLMISPSRRKTDLLVNLLLVDRELSIPREGIFFFCKNLHLCIGDNFEMIPCTRDVIEQFSLNSCMDNCVH